MRLFSICILIIALSHSGCGLKGESQQKGEGKRASEDAVTSESLPEKTDGKNATVKDEDIYISVADGAMLYTPDGDAVVFHATSRKECAGVQDCPGVSETFIQQCLDHNYKMVVYSCCYKGCTGRVK